MEIGSFIVCFKGFYVFFAVLLLIIFKQNIDY